MCSAIAAYSEISFFPVCGSFHFKPVFVCIFTVHADENWLENERNHIQGRRKSLNMLLLRSTNSMSDYSPEKITKPHWNPHEQPSAAGLVVAVQQSCEPLVPSQRPIERKRKERLFVGSADSSGRSGLRPQSRLFHCLSVSQSVSHGKTPKSEMA